MIFPQFPAPPVFLVEPEDKVTKLGSKLTLDCRLAKSGAPALQFWLRDGQTTPLLPGTGGRLAVSSQGSLSIGRITERDAGWYGCAAVSSSGSDLARAEVRVARESDAPPPIIQVGPVNQTLPAKSSATLPCDATDYDALVWLKDGVPLRGTTNRPTQRVSVDSDNTLSIKGPVQVWPLTQFLPVSFL